MDMVEGRSHKLRLGWCIVKNPGQQDILNPSFDRYAEEDTFFRTVQPWNGLPMDRLGVEALRERLQIILVAHIRREFPKVKHEVNAKLEEVKKALKRMSPKRDIPGKHIRILHHEGYRSLFRLLRTHGGSTTKYLQVHKH
ncbi:hypothetical protein SLS58_008931 [Diplodia intermedia]|uniref:Dynamin stalk domain-containing protein n=1 Tax=Diplodia intermedia TaxID=856260 RepID=A0ABR3TFM3_9PEZI